MDFHYGIELPITLFSTELSFDIQNFLNLFDKDAGKVKFVSFQNTTSVNYRGIDAASGRPIYRENFSGAWAAGSQFSIADSRSRWQAKVGLRVSF